MKVSAYPLQWPPNFSRCISRERGAFKVTVTKAMENVDWSLKMFAQDSRKRLESLVISSNVTLGHQKPGDPGVSVWFTWDGLDICIAVDRYQSVEANLQAIHHIIEARRVELRHGTLAMVRASFSGFKALPGPAVRDWWDVLGVPRSAQPEYVKEVFRRLAMENHPDRGGNAGRMAEINEAYQRSLKP